MNTFKTLVWAVGIAGGMLITSCGPTYKENARIPFSEYNAATVSVASVGDKDANYQVIKPFTATAGVRYEQGSWYSNRKIYIDDKLVYEYEYNDGNKNSQWLKSFNASHMDLGFLQGVNDSNDVTYPDPRALSRQLAYAKIIKELIAVGGDAITVPVISIEVDGNSYLTTVKTNLVRLNTSQSK